VLFEGGLIPMFLIIGIWGGKRRVYASFKFFPHLPLGADAARDHEHVLVHRHQRHRRTAANPHSRAHMQILAVAGFLRQLCGQMPMWPVHTCRTPMSRRRRRFGHPGRYS
jgi:NADH-quinone oxidoreductase subunit M